MERVIPVLQIDDYDQAVDFYATRLGFTILFEHRHEPGFPVYMVVKHGDLLYRSVRAWTRPSGVGNLHNC